MKSLPGEFREQEHKKDIMIIIKYFLLLYEMDDRKKLE